MSEFEKLTALEAAIEANDEKKILAAFSAAISCERMILAGGSEGEEESDLEAIDDGELFYLIGYTSEEAAGKADLPVMEMPLEDMAMIVAQSELDGILLNDTYMIKKEDIIQALSEIEEE